MAFSGGKDSIVCKKLLELAKVKFDSHYSITTVDPPELTRFIKAFHPDVIREVPKINMWDLIVKNKMPPTRTKRYCCRILKEGGGTGRYVVTGVRWAESPRRKDTRSEIEYDVFGANSVYGKHQREQFYLMNDNDEKRRHMESCYSKGKHIFNIIIDWSDEEVWEFIHEYELPYPKLYDEGYDRLGCIGCPMSTQETDFAKYPHYRKLYLKAFDRMLENIRSEGKSHDWVDAEDVMDWWLEKRNKV